jgi:hypothetical protein
VEVVEVDRPNRQLRRRQGKTDTLDAIEAARAAQSGRAFGQAKSRDRNVEAIRALMVAKRGVVLPTAHESGGSERICPPATCCPRTAWKRMVRWSAL